jgi:hypothetical protein
MATLARHAGGFKPAGPAPTTTTLRSLSALAMSCGMVASRLVAAFWMHSTSWP